MTHNTDYELTHEHAVLSSYGWRCLACGWSTTSYGNPNTARRGAEDHIATAHNDSSGSGSADIPG